MKSKQEDMIKERERQLAHKRLEAELKNADQAKQENEDILRKKAK